MKRFNLAKGICATLFACALILGCLGAVKANAATTATYNPETDEITITTDAEKIYYAVGKDESGVELKPEKFTKVTVTSGGAVIGVADKKGLKTAINKDTFFYVAEGEPKAATGEKTVKIAAVSLKVAKTSVKKLVVNLDYTKATVSGTGIAVSSIEVTDNDKVKKTYKAGDEVFGRLQYSKDGKTWKPASEYTLGDLAADTVKGQKYQFRIAGTATERCSKAAKVSVKKAGKAAKAPKLDVTKLTVAIKNGMDYFVTTDKDATPDLEKAYTILPYNKEGKATKAIIDTKDFVPYKKAVDEGAASFTDKKYKALPLSEISEYDADPEKTYYVYFRKSAAVGKPAAAWSAVLSFKGQAKAPTFKESAISSATGSAIKVVLPASGSAFEFLILDAADGKDEASLAKVDLSTAKWTKLLAKTKIVVDKTKSKYTNSTEKPTNHTLASGSYILVRSMGDKKKALLPSDYVVTKVEVTGSGDTAVVSWSVVE